GPPASCQTRPAASRNAAGPWARARIAHAPVPSRGRRACRAACWSCRHLEFNARRTHFRYRTRTFAGTRPMLKRVALFLATNLAVLVLLSIIMSVFGINPQSMGGLLV